MFIRFFNNNNPSLFFILPFFAAGLWIVGFKDSPVWMDAHNTLLFESCAKPLFHFPYISTIAAFLLLIAESFVINLLVSSNEVILKKSFLPALFYIVFMSNNEAMLTFHPPLVANLFILFAIHRLLESYRKNYAFAESFDAGMYLSLASLFYFPSIILFPLLGIGLIIFRSYNWREWIISFMGVLVPYCFVLTYYFWNNTIPSFWKDAKTYFVLHERPSFDFSSTFYFMMLAGIIIIFVSFGKITNSIITGSQKTKKNLLFIVWFLLFAIASISLAPSLTSPYFSILAIPVAIFSANHFISMKKEMVGEFIFILFIAAILINDFAKYF